jgi:hypothetical protein
MGASRVPLSLILFSKTIAKLCNEAIFQLSFVVELNVRKAKEIIIESEKNKRSK